jgi:phytanoyl-CoA hydroxylase
MDRPTLLDEMRAFNAADYQAMYPDIAKGIEDGALSDCWTHYELCGRSEERKICVFDEDFYLRSYALAAREVAAGRVATAFDHYLILGRGRGYLPHMTAARPKNPSGPASPCGGLWIDAADALDRVHGRYETGQITETQAINLENFVRDGYVILRGGVSEAVGKAACADLDRAYRGEMPGLLFECPALGRGATAWGAETLTTPAKALDIHWFSKSIRKLIFAPSVTEFLALIFESKAFASQTLGFLRGSGQRSHQDSAYVPYTCATSFAASWIALEDVTEGGGELFYYEGSHRTPDFFYDGKYKSVSEATRANATNTLGAQIDEHVRLLDENAGRFGLERKRLMARQGDVLIWHADLIHGGDPVSRQITRKSIVTHYCPKHHAPLFCEGRKLGFHDHGGHAFTSSLYPGLPLVDAVSADTTSAHTPDPIVHELKQLIAAS